VLPVMNQLGNSFQGPSLNNDADVFGCANNLYCILGISSVVLSTVLGADRCGAFSSVDFCWCDRMEHIRRSHNASKTSLLVVASDLVSELS
jgi:hypothetical protein